MVVATCEQAMEVGLETEEDQSKKMVRWEKFLPRMVLRVLLVEADDSTRHVIAALLRKCSYKVAAVPDGLKAWETLKQKASEIDIILTEVELPSISGFALLTLIMEHDICKNIPVIMMSTHDSVSLALKCILKGAADFLIKPVRRNELRNLWQHVWRRHEISRQPQNLTFLQKKLEAASENDAASSGSVASTQKSNGHPEKGSEAQSTCTSPILEAESACMQNMQGTSYVKSSSNLSNIDTMQHEDSTILGLEKLSVKHDNEVGEKSVALLSTAAKFDKNFKSTDSGQDHGRDCPEKKNQVEVLRAEPSRDNPDDTQIHECNHGLVEGVIDLIATLKNLPDIYDESCNLSGVGTKKVDFDPRLELSLRQDFPGSSSKQTTDEKQALNHSKASAFSWYNGCKFPSPLGSSAKAGGNRGNSCEASKLSGRTVGTSRQFGGTNHTSENKTTLDIDRFVQVERQLSNSQLGPFPAAAVTSDNKPTGYGYGFPMFYAQSDVHSTQIPKPNCPKESFPSPILKSNSFQSNPESYNSEQRYHCSDDPICTSRDKTANEKSNLDPAGRHSSAVDQSTSNTSCHDTANQNNNDDDNTSAYKLACKIDGNASSAAVVKRNPENYGDSGHSYDGYRGTDSHCPSQREAALTKFRMKRKERCYEKKVRYLSRKRLAEQRPRVKGQFVRQMHNDDHPVADVDGGS